MLTSKFATKKNMVPRKKYGPKEKICSQRKKVLPTKKSALNEKLHDTCDPCADANIQVRREKTNLLATRKKAPKGKIRSQRKKVNKILMPSGSCNELLER